MTPEEHPDPAARAVAETLVARLPRIRALHGRTVVVVAGHAVLADDKLRHAFCGDIGFLRYSGVRVVVVHDGGPHLPAWLDDAPAALRTHTAGYVQRGLVGGLNDHTTLAVGLTGEDGRMLVVDGGGGVTVDPGVLRVFLDSGRIPVVSSIAYGEDGGIRHLAAAPAAIALASALGAALVLPAGAGAGAGAVEAPSATFVDMSVPHAVLTHLHRL